MITLSDLRARAEKFQRRVHWRCALTLRQSGRRINEARSIPAQAIPGGLLLVRRAVRASGSCGGLGAAPRAIWRPHRGISAPALPTRQRDVMAGAWAWYIAPFMPGWIWEL